MEAVMDFTRDKSSQRVEFLEWKLDTGGDVTLEDGYEYKEILMAFDKEDYESWVAEDMDLDDLLPELLQCEMKGEGGLESTYLEYIAKSILDKITEDMVELEAERELD